MLYSFEKWLMALMLVATSAVVQAQVYTQTFITEPVEVMYVRGELRFCELKNLRGITCGYEQNLFGRKSFAARDWWSPETYVQAKTGLNDFYLHSVAPSPDGQGLAITFSQ